MQHYLTLYDYNTAIIDQFVWIHGSIQTVNDLFPSIDTTEWNVFIKHRIAFITLSITNVSNMDLVNMQATNKIDGFTVKVFLRSTSDDSINDPLHFFNDIPQIYYQFFIVVLVATAFLSVILYCVCRSHDAVAESPIIRAAVITKQNGAVMQNQAPQTRYDIMPMQHPSNLSCPYAPAPAAIAHGNRSNNNTTSLVQLRDMRSDILNVRIF
jgi:hypothetical protein